MAGVFISHSSRDNAAAAELKDWLDEQGFTSAFLDFDKYSGIPVGADWERTLYQEIERCQALLIVQTPSWSSSRWCFAEFTQARALGKPIFQVVVSEEGAAEAPIAVDLQRLNLCNNRAAGLEQLRIQLERIALQAQGGFPWPPPAEPSRPPFPGLMAFDAEDAPVFFGRDDAWRAVIERLNTRRVQGGPRLLVLQGSSGAGKSSMLRAGVLPRLRRVRRQWLVLPVLRPQARPLEGLAQVLAVALQRPAAWREMHQLLLSCAGAQGIGSLIAGWAADLRLTAGAPEAQLLLPIDQGEELFTVADLEERQRFLAVLETVLHQPLPLQALMTMRADAMSSLQERPNLCNILETLPLGPLPLDRYREIIKGPARVAQLVVEEAFVDRAIHDTTAEDALPLLAFALRQLNDRHGADGVLSLADYEALGDPGACLTPLENAVKQAADAVLKAHRPDEASLKALRKAFIPAMVRVSKQGSYTRRPATWESLPHDAKPLLDALVTARLLVRRQEEGQTSTVEVAHEALLRVWPLLAGWLDDSRAFLVGSQQLEQDLTQWKEAEPAEKPRALLSGLKLAKGLGWLEGGEQLNSELKAFVLRSKRRANHQKMKWLLLGVVVNTFIFHSALVNYLQLKRIRAAQSAQFESTHQALLTSNPFMSVVYGLAAAKAHLEKESPWGAAKLSLSLLRAAKLNHASTVPIQTNQGFVASVVELANGDIASGGSDGTLKQWRNGKLIRTTKLKQEPFPGQITRIIQLSNRDLIAADTHGYIHQIRNGKADNSPTNSGLNGKILNLVELQNGDLEITSSDNILRWPNFNNEGFTTSLADRTEIKGLNEINNEDNRSERHNEPTKLWPYAGLTTKTATTNRGDLIGVAKLPNGTSIYSFANFFGLGRPSEGTLWSRSGPNSMGKQIAVEDAQTAIFSIAAHGRDRFITGDALSNLKWRGNSTSGFQLHKVVNTNQDGVFAIDILENGDVISAGRDGTLRHWIGTNENYSKFNLSVPTKSITTIAPLASGGLAVGDKDGNFKIWEDGGKNGPTIRTGGPAISHIVEISNGVIITAHDDGTIRRWHNGKSIDNDGPIKADKWRLRDVVATKNGEFLTLDDRGSKITRWRKDQRVGEIKPPDTSRRIITLLNLGNGDLLTGYETGEVQRWRNYHKLGSPIKIVKGAIGTSLYKMFLIGVSDDMWMSATSGQMSNGNGRLRLWRNGEPAENSESINIGVVDTGRGEVKDIVLSKNGDLVIHEKEGIRRHSLPDLVRALCSSIDLSTRPIGTNHLAMESAQQSCNDAKK